VFLLISSRLLQVNIVVWLLFLVHYLLQVINKHLGKANIWCWGLRFFNSSRIFVSSLTYCLQMGGLTLTTQNTHWYSLATVWWFWALRRERTCCSWIFGKRHWLLFCALWLINNTRPLRATLYLVNICIQMLIIFSRSRDWSPTSQRLVCWR
jgi:hypothetical protein